MIIKLYYRFFNFFSMKKFLVISIGLIMSNLVVAQTGKKVASAGGAVIYGSEIGNIGLNLFGSWNVGENVRVVPSLSLFIPHHEDFLGWRKSNSMWEINVDGHYIAPVVENKIDLYPLAGLNIAFLTFKGEPNNTDLIHNPKYDYHTSELDPGLNIGFGGDYIMSTHVKFILEFRYTVSNYSQFTVKGGVAYLFR
jgi:hypothetical protein